jgi:hypothetical protein
MKTVRPVEILTLAQHETLNAVPNRHFNLKVVLKEFPDDPIPMPSDHLIELVYEFASLQARDRPTTHHTLHPSALLASALSLNEYIVHMLTPLVKEHVMACLDEEFRVSRGEDESGADEEADEPAGYISSGSDLDEDELLAPQAFPPASKTSKFTSATTPTEQIVPDPPASKPPNMPPKISAPNVRAPVPERTADPSLLSPPAAQPPDFSAPRAPTRTKATSSTSRSSLSSRLSPAAAKRLAAQQAATPLSVETVVSSIQDAGMRSELERLMRVAKSTQRVRTRRRPRTDDSESDESDESDDLTEEEEEEQAYVSTTRSRTRSNTKSTSSKASSSVAKTDSATAIQSTPTAKLPAAKKSTSVKKTGKKATAASPTTVAKRASPKKPTVSATISAGSDEENGSNKTKKDDEKVEPSEYKLRPQDNQEAEDDEMEPPQPKRPRLHEMNNG